MTFGGSRCADAVTAGTGLGSTSRSGGDVSEEHAERTASAQRGELDGRTGRRMGRANLRPSPGARKQSKLRVRMARILHIEDDPGNRLLVRKLLQAAGHSVTEAVDGLEGVQLACAERPDLVLVDLNLPGLDGYEVTLRLRGEASLNGIPIVAITAEGDRDTSLAVGCDGF